MEIYILLISLIKIIIFSKAVYIFSVIIFIWSQVHITRSKVFFKDQIISVKISKLNILLDLQTLLFAEGHAFLVKIQVTVSVFLSQIFCPCWYLCPCQSFRINSSFQILLTHACVCVCMCVCMSVFYTILIIESFFSNLKMI